MKHASILGLALLLALPLPLMADESAKVQIEWLEKGEGDLPEKGDLVTIDYTLTLADGTEIGSTYSRNRPFTLTLDEKHTIQGMLDALLQLRPGAKAKVTIPSALAYGARGKPSRTEGKPPVIPPNTDIVYEVSVREIVRKPRFAATKTGDAKKTASGLIYWVLKEGEGEAPKAEQRAKLSYAIWNGDKEVVFTSHDRQHLIDGKVDKLTLFDRVGRRPLPPEPFLREAALMMKPGARYWFEVPADLSWRMNTPSPKIRPGSTTFWELQLQDIGEVPELDIPNEETATKTSSGVLYNMLVEGTGKSPKARSRVEVHYTGWLLNGRKFDSSFDRGHTQEFSPSGVVPGFKEALLLMKEGGRAFFKLPSALAYGKTGSGALIPPDSDLVFFVELIKVK